MLGRATIRLGIGPHSSLWMKCIQLSDLKHIGRRHILRDLLQRPCYNGIRRSTTVVLDRITHVLLARREHLDRWVAVHLSASTDITQ